MSSTCQTIHYDASHDHNTRNTKVAVARAALCVVLCAHCCIMYLRVPPLKFTSLFISLPPTLLPFSSPSLGRSLLPPLASSLTSFLRSVHDYVPSSLVPFINLPSLPPLPLPPFLTPSLPHALSLLPPPTLPLLLPSLPPSWPLLHSAYVIPPRIRFWRTLHAPTRGCESF